jgi:diguanylate cyclase (GGDEF)-like protein/PAS domain S-box-containing protein
LLHDALDRTFGTGAPFALDLRLRRADGSYRWLHCQGQAVRDGQGEVVGARGTATDVQESRSAERRFKQLVEMAPDAMVFVDDQGLITQINQQTERLFGYDRHELVGMPLEVLIPERYRGVHRHHREDFVMTPDLRPMGRGLDLLARRRDGSEFPVEISLSPLETDEGTIVTASIRDVTDRKLQQDELAYKGLHDSLTGLPNRLLLADRLARAITGLERTPGRCTAVVFLDLDRFKWVNDSLGHDAGDDMLRTVAARLSDALRSEDTVARFGGDEFVVLSSGLSGPGEALQLAERLRVAVSVPVSLQEGYIVVPTMSIGVTTTFDPHADPTALLRDADAAMYRAKDQGRDRTSFFAPEIHAEMSSRLATAGGLRSAIEQGQLRVHYQPIVSLTDGRPLAVEALVRWQHPARGLLLPAEFIELAEETGQIGALDRAVILTACREFGQLVASQASAADLTLNVNVSLQHLSTVQLRDTLLQGLAEGRLRPQQLTVEVTESADLSGDQFAGLLAMVKELGAKVAIDDFGTGFSALSRLGGLAIDTIKVDRSFVTDVHTSRRGQALVAAMTQLSAALGATVIAEGIEHESQADRLRVLGCQGGQGFWCSKGIPIRELASWLRIREAQGLYEPA